MPQSKPLSSKDGRVVALTAIVGTVCTIAVIWMFVAAVRTNNRTAPSGPAEEQQASLPRQVSPSRPATGPPSPEGLDEEAWAQLEHQLLEYDDPIPRPAPQEPDESEEDFPVTFRAAAMGEWIQVGPISWRVTKVKGFNRLRGGFDKWVEPAGARFVVVYLDARLVGGMTRRVDSDQLYLMDRTSETIYKPDRDAQWHAKVDYLSSQQLHPNITVPLRTAFDVPASVQSPVLLIEGPSRYSFPPSEKPLIACVPLD